MKKIFAIAAIALFMASCSDDDSTSNNTENTVLLKKTIETSSEGTLTSTFTYSGTKLTKITRNDGSYDEYIYEGDLVTSIKYHEGGEIIQEDIFTYNSDNKLATFTTLSFDEEIGDKNEYIYNSNGTITVNGYYGDLDSQTYEGGTGTITITNGNIIKYESDGEVFQYTYDSKNFPLKNITSYDSMTLSYPEAGGGLNNTVTYTANFGGSDDESSVFSYTYNAAGYPLTSTEVLNSFGDEEQINIQYFYE
ncbi:hypothetical protein [Flavobacterium sp. NRK1]|uniref:hypothetical protein n=1 Tax=Flavobacterium sp. NRK1 TaxID=2954929 RepID=UPI00209341EC|nr:hypothetical protein [Flavobacterium sp. NRK1]MCO6148263.1 hypothetical protein [Flavobacterium sp. NRK1]